VRIEPVSMNMGGGAKSHAPWLQARLQTLLSIPRLRTPMPRRPGEL